MSGIIDSAVQAMAGASRRIDLSAINIANISTPGFKRLTQSRDVGTVDTPFADMLWRVRTDNSSGSVVTTGRPLDVAINGPGYFKVRLGERFAYTRQGDFVRMADGTLATPQGYRLQQSGGGDLVIAGDAPKMLGDGTVIDADRPVGKVAVYRPSGTDIAQPLDGSLFEIADGAEKEIAAPSVRPGALESSNVSLGDEMVGTMAAMRGAETGAKLVQVYDDLLGRAIQIFGQVR